MVVHYSLHTFVFQMELDHSITRAKMYLLLSHHDQAYNVGVCNTAKPHLYITYEYCLYMVKMQNQVL